MSRVWSIGLLGLCLAAGARAQTMEEMSVAREFIRGLASEDLAPVTAMVDFERRSAERRARGVEPHTWSELDEAARAMVIQFALDEWIGSERAFVRSARLISVQAVADPDAGFGPVPDRHVLRLVLHRATSNQYRDALLTLAPDLKVLDFEQGEPYAPGENPAGPTGMLPQPRLANGRNGVRWPDNIETALYDEVTRLVDTLLAADEAGLPAAYRELHVLGRPAVAALIERLATVQGAAPDPAAATRILESLRQITGLDAAAPAQPTGDDAPPPPPTDAPGWLAWHGEHGWSFVPTPLPAEAVAAATTPPAPGDASSAAPAADKPAEPWVERVTYIPPPEVPGDFLLPEAADLKLSYAGKRVTGRDIEAQIPPCLRVALNTWAETAVRHQLDVVSTGRPEHLVIGSVTDRQLDEIARWLDSAAELLDPLVPVIPPRKPRTVVALVFNEGGQRSKAWKGVLDDMSRKKLVYDDALADLRARPGNLTRRQLPMFIELTWDLTGEGEWQLGNEIVAKFTQCFVTSRVGELPPAVLWGLSNMAEIRLFKSVYNINTSGFVYSADHFDWPVRTKQSLEKRLEKKSFSLASEAADDISAGQILPAQMITWAALDYLCAKKPEELARLLNDLAALQDTADPMHRQSTWRAGRADTLAALHATLDGVEVKTLLSWLDRN